MVSEMTVQRFDDQYSSGEKRTKQKQCSAGSDVAGPPIPMQHDRADQRKDVPHVLHAIAQTSPQYATLCYAVLRCVTLCCVQRWNLVQHR